MSKPGSEPTTGPDINADRLVKVAELRYWDRLSRKEIAARLSTGRSEQFNESNVNHWLDDARALGVVAIDIDRSFALAGKINRRASERLMRAFALEQALVVDVSSDARADSKGADLHIALANRTGMSLSGGDDHLGLLTSRSCILVAGGRTVVQIARKISRQPLTKLNIRIDPLSGRNWTGCWQVDGPDDLERPLDADDAAIILASAFLQSGTI